ncbi:MAG: hypothetical protein ABI687_12365 [Flavitalea sp.]
MHLQKAVDNLCTQLAGTIERLSPSQYSEPCKSLSNNTIGQHVRHIIELFQTLDISYQEGLVNYEIRKRDKLIESNRNIGLQLVKNIAINIDKPNKDMMLVVHYEQNDQLSQPISIPTNYYREIAFNLEHTIHHMAMIRSGIIEISGIVLPENFGVAAATIKHRKQCAQ